MTGQYQSICVMANTVDSLTKNGRPQFCSPYIPAFYQATPFLHNYIVFSEAAASFRPHNGNAVKIVPTKTTCTGSVCWRVFVCVTESE